MSRPIGVDSQSAASAADDEHPQDFLGRVGDRRQGIGGEDGKARNARQALVMREVRGDRVADQEPLERRE